MYRVIKHFIDLHDNDHPYNVGDIFPREGITVTEKRIAELAGSDNKQGAPLIEPEDESGKEETDAESLEAGKEPGKPPNLKKERVKKTGK